MIPILQAVLALTAWSWGAIGYTTFAQPDGDFKLEYPSDWKRYPGMQTVWLEPPGREARVKVGLELHPYGKETSDPALYAAELIRAVGHIKKLDLRQDALVAGRKAEKIAMTETFEPKGPHGEKLPGPMREIHYVVPVAEKWFYVLKIQGIGEDFDKALPEFERIAGKVELKAPVLPEFGGKASKAKKEASREKAAKKAPAKAPGKDGAKPAKPGAAQGESKP